MAKKTFSILNVFFMGLFLSACVLPQKFAPELSSRWTEKPDRSLLVHVDSIIHTRDEVRMKTRVENKYSEPVIIRNHSFRALLNGKEAFQSSGNLDVVKIPAGATQDFGLVFFFDPDLAVEGQLDLILENSVRGENPKTRKELPELKMSFPVTDNHGFKKVKLEKTEQKRN